MAGPPAIVAVDGGNSKTDVLVVDAAGTVLGRARGGGSNHQLFGIDAAMEAIGAAVADAMAAAGVADASSPLCGVGVYCLAGVDLPADDWRVGEAVDARRWSESSLVANDTFALWRAGSDADWGVGVVCGTGLNCVGRAPDGATVRFPSLGELSGDFAAGGAWLGMRGLGLALRARDGRGAPSALEVRVPAHFGLADPEAVLDAVYGGRLGYDRLFELARVVLEAARAGDGPARAAAEQLADEVVAMAGAAIRRLHLEATPVEVVLGGGVFDTEDAAFTARVGAGITAVAPRAQVHVAQARPVVGAALLGVDQLERSGSLSADGARVARQRLREAPSPASP